LTELVLKAKPHMYAERDGGPTQSSEDEQLPKSVFSKTSLDLETLFS
jgi:hypothetical protein